MHIPIPFIYSTCFALPINDGGLAALGLVTIAGVGIEIGMLVVLLFRCRGTGRAACTGALGFAMDTGITVGKTECAWGACTSTDAGTEMLTLFSSRAARDVDRDRTDTTFDTESGWSACVVDELSITTTVSESPLACDVWVKTVVVTDAAVVVCKRNDGNQKILVNSLNTQKKTKFCEGI